MTSLWLDTSLNVKLPLAMTSQWRIWNSVVCWLDTDNVAWLSLPEIIVCRIYSVLPLSKVVKLNLHESNVRCSMTGGSGSVYLGVLLGTTDVAIKVIDSPSPDDQKRFEREVALLKACRHPNVIQFLGASFLADQTLLVMEFMQGGDLFNQLRKDSFGLLLWNKRWVIATQISPTSDQDYLWCFLPILSCPFLWMHACIGWWWMPHQMYEDNGVDIGWGMGGRERV